MARFPRVPRPLLSLLGAGRTDPPGPRHRRLTIGPVYLPTVAELGLALILFLSGNADLTFQNARHGHPYPDVVLIALSFLGTLPLPLRGSRPLAAWWLSAAVMVLSSIAVPPRSLLAAPYPPTLAWSTYCACIPWRCAASAW